MKLVRFPTGAIWNIESAVGFEISSSTITATYPSGGTLTYTTSTDEDANFLFSQIVERLQSGFSGIVNLVLIGFTTITPNPGSLAAGATLTITGTNFDKVQNLKVFIDDGGGITFYEYTVVSVSATEIVLTTVLNSGAGPTPFDLLIKDGTTDVYRGIDVLMLS